MCHEDHDGKRIWFNYELTLIPKISHTPITDPGPSAKDRWKRRTFEGPQHDPTQLARKAGVPYFRQGKRDRPLMPDNFMPVGPHAGKMLRAVPPDYLLWTYQQPWIRNWHHYLPVLDYIERFILPDAETAAAIDVPTTNVIFMDPVQQHPTSIRCFKNGSSHLHTLPGYLDLLHAFALGALGLRPDWFQNKQVPHYDLTIGKHQQALQCGAEEINRRQFGEHLQQWRTFRDNRPRPADDPSTHTRIKHQFP